MDCRQNAGYRMLSGFILGKTKIPTATIIARAILSMFELGIGGGMIVVMEISRIRTGYYLADDLHRVATRQLRP